MSEKTTDELPKVKREMGVADIEHYSKYYVTSTCCRNCGMRNGAYIRKGVFQAGLQIECDNCGCGIDL